MNYLPIGTKVRVNAIFAKKKINEDSLDDMDVEFGGRHTKTEWQSVPCEPKQGVIVGLRRVQDGELIYVNENGSYYHEPDYSFDHFKATRNHIVYLVSLNRWHEPVKVAMQDVEPDKE
jgi:hypothetical protein